MQIKMYFDDDTSICNMCFLFHRDYWIIFLIDWCFFVLNYYVLMALFEDVEIDQNFGFFFVIDEAAKISYWFLRWFCINKFTKNFSFFSFCKTCLKHKSTFQLNKIDTRYWLSYKIIIISEIFSSYNVYCEGSSFFQYISINSYFIFRTVFKISSFFFVTCRRFYAFYGFTKFSSSYKLLRKLCINACSFYDFICVAALKITPKNAFNEIKCKVCACFLLVYEFIDSVLHQEIKFFLMLFLYYVTVWRNW